MKRLTVFAVGAIATLIASCGTPTAEAPTPEATAETAAETPAETVTEEATEAASAGTPEAVFIEDGVAIRGADTVAYFTEGEYVPGTEEFTHDWGGATWQFASAENRDAFAADPEQYAPQYGGFCAWAVSEGYTAPVDPTAWSVVDGKLYLNYDEGVQERWERDIPGNIAKADENWPNVATN